MDKEIVNLLVGIQKDLVNIKKDLENIKTSDSDTILRLKRVETKLSHGFEANGINITDKNIKDNVLNKIFIERKDDTKHNVVRILHEDVTIKDFKDFFKDKKGDFIIVSGGETWITKI